MVGVPRGGTRTTTESGLGVGRIAEWRAPGMSATAKQAHFPSTKRLAGVVHHFEVARNFQWPVVLQGNRGDHVSMLMKWMPISHTALMVPRLSGWTTSTFPPSA